MVSSTAGRSRMEAEMQGSIGSRDRPARRWGHYRVKRWGGAFVMTMVAMSAFGGVLMLDMAGLRVDSAAMGILCSVGGG